MKNYKSSKGIEYEYGDRMKRAIYDCEDRLHRKRLRTIKSNRNEVLYDNDTGRFIADDMTEKIWDEALRVIRKEMRAIIYHMRDHSLFAEVRPQIPSSWKGKWIDFIHSYAVPDIDSR